MNLDPLYNLIIELESLGAVKQQGVESPYDVVWGNIRADDRPKQLSLMTVQEVLDWQDSIDSRYMSEAAGAFQIMEDTLRGLVDTKQIPPNLIFDKAGQELCCRALLESRGLKRFLSGEISIEKFADNLAREWASFPVQSDQRGKTQMVRRGQSYYAGDLLNYSRAAPEKVLAALAQIATPAPNIAELKEWLSAMPAWLKS